MTVNWVPKQSRALNGGWYLVEKDRGGCFPWTERKRGTKQNVNFPDFGSAQMYADLFNGHGWTPAYVETFDPSGPRGATL